MEYRFVVEEIRAARGKLSREERQDITRYFESASIEAEDEKRAYRQLSRRSAGRLSQDSTKERAVITLPDYGGSQVVVRAYKEK